jgi:hypothetical protein
MNVQPRFVRRQVLDDFVSAGFEVSLAESKQFEKSTFVRNAVKLLRTDALRYAAKQGYPYAVVHGMGYAPVDMDWASAKIDFYLVRK